MTTDSERREVARRLREYVDLPDDWWADTYSGFYVEKCAFGNVERHRESELFARLADLIEPSGHGCVPGECPLNVCHDNDRIDRERLLAIATMMAADSVRSAKQGSSVSPVYILHAARNIAEACGETFGSIRNRELAEWGTSIVPKETIVDRDELLSLADEIEEKAQFAHASTEHAVIYAGYAREYESFARRIREACGEGER